MSLQATEDGEHTEENPTMNGSGKKSGEKDEMQEQPTAVIQMTIQPQSASSTENVISEPPGVALAELPQPLLDIAPIEAQAESADSATAFEYVAEMERAPQPPPPPPRPAFSYRTEAALMHHLPASRPAHSADTYDYTEPDEPRTVETLP